MSNPMNVSDASLDVLKSLPATATTGYSDAIQVKGAAGAREDFLATCEVLIEAPALNATELPSAETMTYTLQHSNTLGSGYVSLYSAVIVQTGNTVCSAGAAAAVEKRIRLPEDCLEFIRLAITGVGNGDCSASDAELKLVF